MKDNIVEMDGRRGPSQPAPVSDFWFAQLDQRLSRIELMVMRLEWQILFVACGSFGLLLLEIIRAVRGI